MRQQSGALIGAALFIWVSGPTQSGEVGAYICAVDNCGKQFLDRSQAEAEACRAGVQGANNSPSSPDCLKMCETSYGSKGGGVKDACLKGCEMFPSECLRDGNVPPEDPQLKRQRQERYAPQRPNPPQQRRYRDYRYW